MNVPPPLTVLRFLATFCAAITILSTPAWPETAKQPSLITSSGQPIQSVFDGLSPNQQVRDSILPRATLLKSTGSLNLKTPASLITGIPVAAANSCPQGGLCAQPGTGPTFGQDCEDSLGCDVIVHNQIDTPDFTHGTFESYQCSTCCVDWVNCLIGDSAPSDPGCNNVGDSDGFTPADGGAGNDGCSPIIIDTEAEGFHLTSAANGVPFDISGTGHPIQIAWTDQHFHNAFLALPGSDILVHNGKDLFGNFTFQPPSAQPNGFIALAEYDKPQNGGNGDGVIDEKDQVFSRLRLWIDENHDGICQAAELHKLSEFGIYSLALNYVESRRVDEFGNQFRFRSLVNPGPRKDPHDSTQSGKPGRWSYDVFLAVK